MDEGSSKLLHAEETYQIQGAVFEVNRELGAGFLEAVYQEALALEFTQRGIPFQAMPALVASYKGQALRQTYQPDFICFDKVIVELKALSVLGAAHRAQALNYLKATGLRVALLVNFGAFPKAEIERVAL